MQLHMKYLQSLEDSERVRLACLRYLQTCFIYYYPEMSDIVREVERLANELGGQIVFPSLSWKYSWMKALLGLKLAKRTQGSVLSLKWSLVRLWDKALYKWERPKVAWHL